MNFEKINLEMLIKAYAQLQNKSGIFISILEYNEGLREILKVSKSELIDLVDNYLYLSDFNNNEEIHSTFEILKEKSHEDAQYAVLVIDNEIIEEFYYGI